MTLIDFGGNGGAVVIVGWDWFDGAPNGSKDGGWVSVVVAGLESL